MWEFNNNSGGSDYAGKTFKTYNKQLICPVKLYACCWNPRNFREADDFTN
jgi:hypothetical protein